MLLRFGGIIARKKLPEALTVSAAARTVEYEEVRGGTCFCHDKDGEGVTAERGERVGFGG